MNHTSGSNKQTTMTSLPEFDSDKLDELLYSDKLDWSFDKPAENKNYHTVYIFQDFARPNPYKQKWDAVTKQMEANINGFLWMDDDYKPIDEKNKEDEGGETSAFVYNLFWNFGFN